MTQRKALQFPAMRVALTALLVALALGMPTAQPSFRSGIELVTAPVTVKHKDAARAVPDITAADLRVFENGTEQRIDSSSATPARSAAPSSSTSAAACRA